MRLLVYGFAYIFCIASDEQMKVVQLMAVPGRENKTRERPCERQLKEGRRKEKHGTAENQR